MTRGDEHHPRDALVVEFMGAEHIVHPEEELTFGRHADLVVDDANPYMHRRLGRFWNADGVWMLQNTGTTVKLTMADTASTSRLSLAPGGSVVIPFEDSRLTFEVQGAAYALDIEVPFALLEDAIDQTTSGVATVRVGNVALTESQRQCIVALAMRRLQHPGAPIDAIPSNKEAYTRLGWSPTKFNRKLDNVCEKLTKSGVRGLQGEQGQLARRRRQKLVDHAITTGLVTAADLDLLP